MRPAYSIAERALWLCALAALAFFWRWGLRELSADSARAAGEALRSLSDPAAQKLWGVWVLSHFGVSENSARAIAAIPAGVGVVTLFVWMWVRMGWGTVVAGLLVLALNSWMGFFASASADAAFSLALIVTALAAYECHWRGTSRWAVRPPWIIALIGALFFSTFSRGVPGFAAWGGLVTSLFLAFLFSERAFFKLFISFLFNGVFFFVACVPFVWSAYKLVHGQDVPGFATSTFQSFVQTHPSLAAGEWTSISWSPAESLINFLRESLLWLWLVPAFWVAAVARRKDKDPRRSLMAAWSLNVIAFVLPCALFAGFLGDDAPSFMRASAPLFWPIGALFLSYLFGLNARAWNLIQGAGLRWGIFVLLLAVGALIRPLAQSPRADRFRALGEKINGLPADCALLVPKDAVTEYDLKSFAAWYLNGRAWAIHERELPSVLAVPRHTIYWDPRRKNLWGQGECNP